MKRCVVCKEEFEAKRTDAVYCSALCRKRVSRINVTDNHVTDNATDNSVYSSPAVVSEEHVFEGGAFGRGYCECGKDAYFGDKCMNHYAEIVRNSCE